ncbi:MAG: hypothetical protein JW829_04500 [Pirellulales bacterium]|nr:hypothetical protein [Pirellulales bacterium]
MEIGAQLERMGTPVGPSTVRRLLEELGFRKSQDEKTKTMGNPPFRSEQFEYIARLKQRYLRLPNPIISMGTRKNELLGEFFSADGRTSRRRLVRHHPALRPTGNKSCECVLAACLPLPVVSSMYKMGCRRYQFGNRVVFDLPGRAQYSVFFIPYSLFGA